MNAIQIFIINFSIVPVAITAVIGLARYPRLSLMQRYLLLLTGFALAMEIASRTLTHYKVPNLFLVPIDTVLEFSALALIYRRALWPNRISRLIPGVAALFILGSVLSYSPQFDSTHFSPMQRFLESVLVLILVGSYFHREITRQLITQRLERQPMFWVSSGLLLYFLSNMLIFLSSNYVLNLSVQLSVQMWAIHAMLYIFLNCLYAVAIALPAPGAVRPLKVTQA